jgi:hypothetical protein
MREYFRSPYVIIGVIGIVYYLYRRNILVNKMNKEMLPALSSFSDDIPMEFKNDVEKMSFGEMRKCIYENEKLIADKKLQPNEEKKVAKMVKYVVDYNNKNIKKR